MITNFKDGTFHILAPENSLISELNIKRHHVVHGKALLHMTFSDNHSLEQSKPNLYKIINKGSINLVRIFYCTT